MVLIDHLIQALQTLNANRLRSFLSILGLVIGVLSVTILVSLVEGLQGQILAELNEVSKNTVSIVGGRDFNPFNPVRSQEFPGFTESDIAYLENSTDIENEIVAATQLTETIYYRGSPLEGATVQFGGVEVGMDEIESIDIVQGRWLNQNDLDKARNVLVISESVTEKLFEGENPIGQEFVIADQTFKVIGVTETVTVGFLDAQIFYAPLTTVHQKILGDPFYQYLIVKVKLDIEVDYAVQILSFLMLKRQGIDHMDDAQFQVISTEAFLEQFNTITQLLQFGLGGVGAIALLVGGIGVMNIMLVSVSERTREIGIRKAIGAKNRDIVLQFLTESIMLGIIGGGIGVLISWGIIEGLQFAGIPALMNFDTLAVAVIFSLSVGVIFGVGPARKAAKLKPIDALRYE